MLQIPQKSWWIKRNVTLPNLIKDIIRVASFSSNCFVKCTWDTVPCKLQAITNQTLWLQRIILFLTLYLNKLKKVSLCENIVVNFYFKIWPFIWTNLNFLYLSRAGETVSRLEKSKAEGNRDLEWSKERSPKQSETESNCSGPTLHKE